MNENIKQQIKELEEAYGELSRALHCSQYGTVYFKTISKYRDYLYDSLEELRRKV